MKRLWMRVRNALVHFFFPPPGAKVTVRVLPYAVLGLLTVGLLTGSAYAWDYTNSPPFCGTTCHTMPPEYTAYQVSPHARIACVECHIGREFIGNQVVRKAGDVKHIVALAFKNYEFPLVANDMRPARETCEKCHSPTKFSDDSLRENKSFGSDLANTPQSIYLVLKTGGGSTRQGLGKGIHWHIQNRIVFYAEDREEQKIPYVRVYNDDGTQTEYVDLQSGIDTSKIPEADLREMDCITCHNRITHLVPTPDQAVDRALAAGTIDTSIPDIRRKSVEVLSATYASNEHALQGIAGLTSYYQAAFPDYYAAQPDKIAAAVQALQSIYSDSVYVEQKSDWYTHSNNVGHKDFPGCFRCHDGKHLSDKQEAIRLECNLCHSIPVVAGQQDFVSDIEISRGLEPDTHKNSNWLARHRTYFDRSCSSCHTTGNPGGTDNSSFCSNSACHGSAWKFAGLNAPGLAEVAAAQLPPPVETPLPPVVGVPTYAANIQPLFESVCVPCHGDNKAGGLTLITYEGVMAGGANGPVVVPGDSDASRLIQVQSEAHFANLTAEELELVKQWIAAGAPEQ